MGLMHHQESGGASLTVVVRHLRRDDTLVFGERDSVRVVESRAYLLASLFGLNAAGVTGPVDERHRTGEGPWLGGTVHGVANQAAYHEKHRGREQDTERPAATTPRTRRRLPPGSRHHVVHHHLML